MNRKNENLLCVVMNIGIVLLSIPSDPLFAIIIQTYMCSLAYIDSNYPVP